MRLCNISPNVVIVATPGNHYATLKPGDVAVLDDSMSGDSMIGGMIERGFLKILKGDEKPPKIAAGAKEAQEHVSLFKSEGTGPIKSSSKVVSRIQQGADALGDDQDTVIPVKAGAKKTDLPEGVEEGDGTLLVKMGSKSVPTKIIRVSPRKIEKDAGNPTKIVKQAATAKEVNLDTGGIGQVYVGTGIPGEGKVVDMRNLTDEQLEAIKDQTTKLLEDAKKDRKVMMILNNYQEKGVEERKEMIRTFDDVEVLSTMLKLEKSAALKSMIKGRLNKVAPGDKGE